VPVKGNKMKKVNSDQEVLEFAIFREIEAYHLYLALARHVDTEQMREIFEDLAAEELGHKAKLELEIIKTGRTVTADMQPPRPDSDYIISNDPSLLDMDYRDMLMLGMEKEDVSFRTYVNLIPQAQDEQLRETLLKLAEEEIKHKIRFETEYEAMIKKQ
jgi:rubrerythrin